MEIARALLEQSRKVEAVDESPLQMWQAGERERAIQMVLEKIFQSDHELGTAWALLLAWVAESNGEREWAKRCLDEIRKRWEGKGLKKLKDEYWSSQGDDAVFLLGELGQVEGAVEVAILVLGEDGKEEVAKIWADKGLFEQALQREIGKRALEKITEAMVKAGVRDLTLWQRALELGKETVIAKGMARVRLFEEALELTEKVVSCREHERAEALGGIAAAMMKAGNREQALTIFERAIQMAKDIALRNARDGWLALTGIASAMVEEGIKETEWWRQVIKVVEAIGERVERIIALGELAELLSELEVQETTLWQQILEVVRQMSVGELFLQEIAKSIAKAKVREKDLWQQVVKMAENLMWQQRSMDMNRTKAWTLSVIASEMAKLGLKEEARETFAIALDTAEKVKEAEDRGCALALVAYYMAWTRMNEHDEQLFERAIKLAAQSGEQEYVAEALAKAGQMERAMKIVSKMDADLQAWTLKEIAEFLANAGHFDQALMIAEKIERADMKAWALDLIATMMTDAGQLEQALQVAEKIEEAKRKVWALQEIGRKLKEVGAVSQAQQVFDRCFKEMRRWQWERDRDWAMAEIAKVMAERGLFERAIKVAEGIFFEFERSRAMAEIAKAMMREGKTEQAKELFERALMNAISIYKGVYPKARAEIAQRMAEVGLKERAKQVLNETMEEEDIHEHITADALREIAVAMARLGFVKEAQDIFRQAVDFVGDQAKELKEIAVAMRKVGLQQAQEVFKKAIEVAGEIEWKDEREELLQEIREAMAEQGEIELTGDILEKAKGWRKVKLLQVLATLVERAKTGDEVSREYFFQLLPLCGQSMSLAYRACGFLAHLFPEQAGAIAELIR